MKSNFYGNKKHIKWFTSIIWVIIWYLASYMVGSELILPGPYDVLKALGGLLGTGDFYVNVLWTLLRTVLGTVTSFGLGAAFALLAYRSELLREFLRLPVSFFKSIPVMAIVIYVILVIKSDWVAVAVCFLMCFPIAYTNILNGLCALDVKRIELGKSLGLRSRQMKRFIIIPSLDTQIKTAMSLITAMSWKVVVASEVLAIPEHSIGYQMLNSKYYLQTADLFAYMTVLIILSLLMEKLVSRITTADPVRLSKAVAKEAAKAQPFKEGSGTCEVSFSHVTKTFLNEDGSESVALRDFSYNFGKGVTAVLGSSGRGKTTLARLLSGMILPDEGTVDVGACRRTGYLFQEDRLLPWLNVRANILLACLSGIISETDPESAVRELASKLEIEDALEMMPHELSGGMSHRTALGRTLIYRGKILVLDEPFRGLNDELTDRITGRIMRELKPEGDDRTVILITHDENLAERLADKIIRL